MKVVWRRDFGRIGRCYHGPQTWPWWRLVSFSIMRLTAVAEPSTAYRFWIYTRWAVSFYWTVFFDRRGEPVVPLLERAARNAYRRRWWARWP